MSSSANAAPGRWPAALWLTLALSWAVCPGARAQDVPSLLSTLAEGWRWREVQRDEDPSDFSAVRALPGGRLAVIDGEGLWIWEGATWEARQQSAHLAGTRPSAIVESRHGMVLRGSSGLWLLPNEGSGPAQLIGGDKASPHITIPVRVPGSGSVRVADEAVIKEVGAGGLQPVLTAPPEVGRIYSLFFAPDRTLWCDTDQGIYRHANGRWTHEPLEHEQHLRGRHLTILPVQAGIVFIPAQFSRHSNGLLWDGTSLRHLDDADAAGPLHDAVVSPQGELLVSIGQAGLRLLDRNGHWHTVRRPASVDLAIERMAMTDEGRLAVVTRDGRMLLHDHSSRRWEHYNDFPPGLSPAINVLTPARRGGFWFGTNEGIARFDHGAIQEYHLDAGPDGPPLFGITALQEDRNGHLWVGAGGHMPGALRWDGETWRHEPLPASLGEVSVHAIDRGPDDTLWFTLLSLVEADDAWMGGGVLALREDGWEIQRQQNGDPLGRAYSVTHERDGTAWVGLLGGVGRWTPSGWELLPGPPFSDLNKVFKLFVDSGGTLWAGRDLWSVGVARLPPVGAPRAWQQMQGEVWSRVGAGAIAEHPEGQLWLASDRGLFLARHGVCLEVSTDGVVIEPAFWPLMPDPDGDGLWLGSLGSGLVRLRPDDVSPPRTVARGAALVVPGAGHGVRRVRWRTVDVWASSPAGSMRHRTRVDDGPWSHWSAPGAASEFITHDLRPDASHAVQVESMDAFGNRESRPLSFTFTVPPLPLPTWREPPMLTVFSLLLLSLATLAWVLVRRRRDLRLDARARNDLTARLRELAARLLTTQDEERLAISRDLHDDLGQLLTATCMHLEHATSIPPGDQQDASLSRAHAAAVRSLHSMRSLVARVRPPSIEHMGLEGALRGAVEEFTASTGLEVVTELKLGRIKIPRSAAENIWRILKEALTNVARHADAGRIDVLLEATSEALNLTLTDDGRGFRPGRRPASGVGLLGMRERAESLGGHMTLESEPGAGTRLHVSIPIERDQDHTHEREA